MNPSDGQIQFRRRTTRIFVPPASNRCGKCGRWVGDKYTGFTEDRFSDRGKLWCEPCLSDSPAPALESKVGQPGDGGDK